MTIDEAIKCLHELTPPPMDSWCEEYTEAVKLGIEALKRERQRRHLELTGIVILLPGETKD